MVTPDLPFLRFSVGGGARRVAEGEGAADGGGGLERENAASRRDIISFFCLASSFWLTELLPLEVDGTSELLSSQSNLSGQGMTTPFFNSRG